MTLGEKLTAIGEKMPEIYDRGKDWVFQHMTQPSGLFYKAAFPEGSSLRVSMPNCKGPLTEMFRLVTGLQILELELPDAAYKANHMFYGSAIRELYLPNGLRATDFSNFASCNYVLEAVYGVIDLTESSSNNSCFANCDALREVRFAPGSIHKSLSFKHSAQLSAATVTSVLEGLAPVETTQTLALHNTVRATLTDAQLASITAKNWQLA